VRAACYIRVSTDRQATDGLSLGEQDRRVRAHVDAQEGWELVDVFVDAGISGKRDDRPALVALLGRLDEIDVLVVPKLDRLGRSARHLHNVYAQLEAAGVAFVSLADGFDTTTVGGRLTRSLLSAMAEFEADTISERVRSVMGVRARAGKHHGGPSMYGFRYVDGALEHDERQALVVRSVFQRFVAGETQRAIQRDLNRRGVPTQRGGPWHQGNIAKMLRNPAYVGRVRLNGETYDGEHVAIVEQEVWEAAQRLLRPATAGSRGRPTSGSHLFAKGLLRCGECGASMVPRTIKSGKTRRYSYEVYVCYRHLSDHDACARKPVKRAPLDDAVLRYFANVAVDVEATRTHVLERLSRQRGDTVAELRRARRDVAENAAQRARIERDYLSGELTAAGYEPLRVKLDEEREVAEAEAEQLAERLAALDATAIQDELDAGGLADLAVIREAVAEQLRTANGVQEVRAGLRRLFDSFVLHAYDPDAAEVALDLEFGHEFGPGMFEWWLEPRLRADAIDGFERLVQWDPELGDLPRGGFSTAVRPRLKRLAIALDIDNDGRIT
jgi:site-specific DNA recombinase